MKIAEKTSNSLISLDSLKEMIIQSGTQEAQNPADIPLIIEKINALSAENPTFYKQINSLKYTDVILKTLSEKCGKKPEFIAAKYDSPGARNWLWHYIQYHKLDTYYDSILDVVDIVSELFKKAKEIGFLSHPKLFTKEGPECSNHTKYQTKKGMGIVDDGSRVQLATKFGCITIVDNWYGDIIILTEEHRGIWEILLRQLKGVFFSNLSSQGKFFQIQPPSDGSTSLRKFNIKTQNEISQEEALQEKHSKLIMYNSRCIYQIGQIKETILDPLEWQDDDDFLDYDGFLLKSKIWELLNCNRKGENLFERKALPSTESQSVIPRPVLPSLAENPSQIVTLSCSVFNQLSNLGTRSLVNAIAIYEDDQESSCSLCSLISELEKAARFRMSKPSDFNRKISLYETFTQLSLLHSVGINPGPKIQEDLEKNPEHSSESYQETIERLFPEVHWETFEARTSAIVNYSEDFFNNKAIQPLSLRKVNTFQQTVEIILKGIMANWKKVKYKDFQNVTRKESEETHDLYVKQKNFLPNETTIIFLLTKILGIDQYVNCSDSWEDHVGFFGQYRPKYIWVKKECSDLFASQVLSQTKDENLKQIEEER